MKNKSIFETLLFILKKVLREYATVVFFILVVLYFFSGIFRVENNEMAVVTRFGAVVRDSVQSGLHYRLPWPFEDSKKVDVRKVQTMILDNFSLKHREEESVAAEYFKKTGLDPYLITGDDNIVAASILIKYNIVDISAYAFNVKDAEKILKKATASILLREISSTEIDHILTVARETVGFNLQKQLQEELDVLETGISVAFVEIRNISPPVSVQPYFDRVVNAEVEKDQMLDQAGSHRHEKLSDAKAEATTAVQQAMGYRGRTLLEAEGKAGSFSTRVTEYLKNPYHNRRTLYLESVGKIFEDVENIHIIDGKNKKSDSNGIYSSVFANGFLQ